jgi:O-antigen ligase
MVIKKYDISIISSLIAILPISILLGSSISLLNVILINFLVIRFFFEKKFYKLTNHLVFKILFIIYIYLVFNLFVAENFSVSFSRNVGFIRFLGLFILINYLFYKNNFSLKIFYIWTFVILFTTIDIFVEYYFGSNIFGWGSTEPHAARVVSFFKDEPVAGAYLYGFILIIFGFLLDKFKDKKIIAFIVLFIGFIAVFITGERSNTIKLFFGIILMFFFLDFFKLKIKIIVLTFIISFFIFFVNQSNYLKNRYIGQLLSNFDSLEKFNDFKERDIYFKHYKSGIAVFKKNIFFGVGNKNYRVETCKNYNTNSNYICTTHPHQIYLEFLSEHGLFGSIIVLGLIFYLIFKVIKNIHIQRNYTQIGALTFLVTVFTPVLPSGSFFSDFNATIFWLNFSIMYAICKNTNIFYNRLNIDFKS